ncbi:HSF-type DNA-binding-domain-containing protein [Choanephora cucurbitarum]|nr:HSF-type DNA-binding-domain-containing protein [Choanephora cucurbitarum]
MAKSSSRSSSSSSGESRNDQRFKRLKLSNNNSSNSSSGSDTERPIANDDTSVVRSSTATISNNPKTQAAFVNKLYKMLEDPESSKLISWSAVGDLFSVSNPTTFSKTVLPQYFKHNNWQSFVRQLNMYGFHKVNDLIHSNLTNENQTWEFKHPNFRRGGVDDLQNIKRKSAKVNQAHWQQVQNQKQQQQQEQQQQRKDEFQNDSERKDRQGQNYQGNSDQEPHSFNSSNDYTHSIDNANQNRDVNDPVIKHILRIEEHLLGVTRSCEQLFSEVVHLRMVVSKQQNAMQDLVDVVSSSSKSNVCACGNANSSNKQELLSAENLRIQVSKLKESQNMNKISNDMYKQSDTNTNWSPNVSNAPPYALKNEPTSARTTSHSSTSSGTTITFTSQNNSSHTYRKLPSLDSLQQQPYYNYSDNLNDGLSRVESLEIKKPSNNNGNSSDIELPVSFERKPSSTSSNSSLASYQPYDPSRLVYTNGIIRLTCDLISLDSEENKTRSSMMSFGKQSHMLNPVEDSQTHRQKQSRQQCKHK